MYIFSTQKNGIISVGEIYMHMMVKIKNGKWEKKLKHDPIINIWTNHGKTNETTSKHVKWGGGWFTQNADNDKN